MPARSSTVSAAASASASAPPTRAYAAPSAAATPCTRSSTRSGLAASRSLCPRAVSGSADGTSTACIRPANRHHASAPRASQQLPPGTAPHHPPDQLAATAPPLAHNSNCCSTCPHRHLQTDLDDDGGVDDGALGTDPLRRRPTASLRRSPARDSSRTIRRSRADRQAANRATISSSLARSPIAATTSACRASCPSPGASWSTARSLGAARATWFRCLSARRNSATGHTRTGLPGVQTSSDISAVHFGHRHPASCAPRSLTSRGGVPPSAIRAARPRSAHSWVSTAAHSARPRPRPRAFGATVTPAMTPRPGADHASHAVATSCGNRLELGLALLEHLDGAASVHRALAVLGVFAEPAQRAVDAFGAVVGPAIQTTLDAVSKAPRRTVAGAFAWR